MLFYDQKPTKMVQRVFWSDFIIATNTYCPLFAISLHQFGPLEQVNKLLLLPVMLAESKFFDEYTGL